MAKWNVDLVTNTACTLTLLILLMNDEHGRSVDVHFTHEVLPSTIAVHAACSGVLIAMHFSKKNY